MSLGFTPHLEVPSERNNKRAVRLGSSSQGTGIERDTNGTRFRDQQGRQHF